MFKTHFTTTNKSSVKSNYQQLKDGQVVVPLTGHEKLKSDKEDLMGQIESNIPRTVLERNLKVFHSRSLAVTLGLAVPDLIEIEDTEDEPNDNLLLKIVMKDKQKQTENAKFRNRRVRELEELQKLKDSKTTIQIAIAISKDLKLEFTASVKELISEIYE